MKNKFTKKIAKQIASRQLDQMLDIALGRQDSWKDGIETESYVFEDNFTEDLEELNISATPKRVEVIKEEYEKMRDKVIKTIEKFYSK